MKHIKLLLSISLLIVFSLNNKLLPAQGLMDSSTYFTTCEAWWPPFNRICFIDTLRINYTNQDTTVFDIGMFLYLKVNNQIYIIEYEFADTILFYDYNLTEGDSISFYNSVYRIDSVKNVEYLNREIYKEWYLSNGVIWIENLGSNRGWNWIGPFIPECTTHLEAICHHNELIYWNFGTLPNGNNPDPTCNFDSLKHLLPVEEINFQNKIQIYPNPATNEIYISEIEGGQFEIINNLGKIVLKGTAAENKIDVFSLSAGVYIIRIVKPAGVYTAKFVKE